MVVSTMSEYVSARHPIIQSHLPLSFHLFSFTGYIFSFTVVWAQKSNFHIQLFPIRPQI